MSVEPVWQSSAMAIEEGWIDYNGHLNMAYYSVLFDRALDEALVEVGLGPDYVREQCASYMTAEVHLCYLRELFKTDPVRVVNRVLDVDGKRLHMYSELVHARDGWVSATAEWLFLHVDMRARKVTPWPGEVLARLEAIRAAGARLPMPERAGRRIGIAR
jgi:acyl-CoA thioester hydrolase